MKRSFLSGVMLVLVCCSALAQEKKLSVPSEADQQQALAAAKDVFGDEWRAAKTAEQKSLLAGKILQKAAESKDEPAARFVLLRLGKDIAVQAGDPDVAHKAAEEMATAFNIDARQSKLETFFAIAKQVPPAKRPSLISWATKILSETVAADDFENAKHVFAVLQATARQSKDRAVTQQVTAMGKELGQIAKAYEAVKPVAQTENLSTDPAASLAVGRYQCFVKGNWAQGLDILKHASDEKLKTLAAKELEGTMGKELALADQWWEVSESLEGREADIVRLHAADLYRKALPQLTALAKARVEKRLAGVKTSVTLTAEGQTPPAVLVSSLPPGAILVLTFESNTFITQGNHILVKDLSGKNNHGEVFGARLVEGKAGKAVDFDGKSYVVVPAKLPLNAEPRTICWWAKLPENVKQVAAHVWCYGDLSTELDRAGWMRSYIDGRNWEVGTGGLRCGSCGTGWHNYAAVFDGKEIRAYFDGQQKNKSAIPVCTVQGPLVIGARQKAGHAEFFFQGSIDEFAFFDRSLSEEEIKQVYDLGVNGQNLARQGR